MLIQNSCFFNSSWWCILRSAIWPNFCLLLAWHIICKTYRTAPQLLHFSFILVAHLRAFQTDAKSLSFNQHSKIDQCHHLHMKFQFQFTDWINCTHPHFSHCQSCLHVKSFDVGFIIGSPKDSEGAKVYLVIPSKLSLAICSLQAMIYRASYLSYHLKKQNMFQMISIAVDSIFCDL